MPSSLTSLWSARSVAVIGASDRSAVHRLALANLRAPGVLRVHGVNPKRREVDGVACVPSAADLAEPPDVALLMVGDGHVERAADDALEAGARWIVVPGLGASPANRDVRQRLSAVVAGEGATLVGPDCMGLLVPGGLQAWIGTLPGDLRPGRLGIASHSGAVGEALVAFGPRYGYRALVSLGLEGGVDVADACELFAEDDGTGAVGLFLEVVRRPAALCAALDALARVGKPVVVLRTGESPAARAAAHVHNETLPGDDAALAACLRSSGAVLARDFAEFAELLAIVDAGRLPAGSRVAGITNSGGEAALLADEAHRAGLPMPPFGEELDAAVGLAVGELRPVCNPVDAWSPTDTAGAYRRTIARLAGSGEFDVVIAQIDQGPELGALERRNAALLAEALVEETRGDDRVIGAIVNGLGSCPIPEVADAVAGSDVLLLGSPGPSLRALAALVRWGPGSRAASPGEAQADGAVDPAGLTLAQALATYGFAEDPAERADTRWPVVEMVARGASPFGPFVGVRAMGGTMAWALAPTAPGLVDQLLADAGLRELPGDVARQVAERLAALSVLAGRCLGSASVTVVHGVGATGPVLLGWHADGEPAAPEPATAEL